MGSSPVADTKEFLKKLPMLKITNHKSLCIIIIIIIIIMNLFHFDFEVVNRIHAVKMTNQRQK